MRLSLELDARRPWPELLVLAGQAERAGWDGVRVADAVGGKDCWAVVAALADSVPRIRLAVVVHDDRGRHPAVVAKLASTVDRLSDGRLVLGWRPAHDPGADARLAEAVTVAQLLMAQARTTFAGRYYRLEDAPLDPQPLQQPLPTLLVGGPATLAAAVADEWTVTAGPGELDRHLDALAQACRERGRDRAEITVSVRSTGRPSGVDKWVVPHAALDEGVEALLRIRTSTI